MPDIDRMMKISTPPPSKAAPMARRDDPVNAAAVTSKNARAGGGSAMPCSKATAFAGKAAPPAGRQPLFRR